MWSCLALCAGRSIRARSAISVRQPAKPCIAACVAANRSTTSRHINFPMSQFYSLKVASVAKNTRDAVVVTFDVPAELHDTFAFRPGQRSAEHTSELQSLMRISYDVFCLKKKKLRDNETRYIKYN